MNHKEIYNIFLGLASDYYTKDESKKLLGELMVLAYNRGAIDALAKKISTNREKILDKFGLK